jgi:hypothetical protein
MSRWSERSAPTPVYPRTPYIRAFFLSEKFWWVRGYSEAPQGFHVGTRRVPDGYTWVPSTFADARSEVEVKIPQYIRGRGCDSRCTRLGGAK